MQQGFRSLATAPGLIVECPVAGFGIVQASPDEIEHLRRDPATPPGMPCSASLLKHSADQTIAGVSAVYQAIQNFELGEGLQQWGVIAAPCLLGRAAMAQSLKRFAVEGAWGISPHFIPHHSVHAVSGTISQALGSQGPNFGVGGMPGGIAEACLVAASLMSSGSLPGLWVVITEHDPEMIPPYPQVTADGQPGPASRCNALALALLPQTRDPQGMSVQICARANSREDGPAPDWYTWEPLQSVLELIGAFMHADARQGNWRLGSAGWIKFRTAGRELHT